MSLSVTVWNEYKHEREYEEIRKVYPEGIHSCIASFWGKEEDIVVRTATFDMPEHGLTEEVLQETDVLIIWSHSLQEEFSDEVAERVRRHVLGGMGLIAMHSEDFDDMNSPLSGMHGIHWFLKQVPQLQYTLDTGNYLFYGENVLETYGLLKERIAHVHCKERHEGDNASVAVGSGYIPFEEVIQRLREQGYEGYLAIEHFDVADQEGCMGRSAAFLKTKIL